jgi:hypothetical protein
LTGGLFNGITRAIQGGDGERITRCSRRTSKDQEGTVILPRFHVQQIMQRSS